MRGVVGFSPRVGGRSPYRWPCGVSRLRAWGGGFGLMARACGWLALTPRAGCGRLWRRFEERTPQPRFPNRGRAWRRAPLPLRGEALSGAFLTVRPDNPAGRLYPGPSLRWPPVPPPRARGAWVGQPALLGGVGTIPACAGSMLGHLQKLPLSFCEPATLRSCDISVNPVIVVFPVAALWFLAGGDGGRA